MKKILIALAVVVFGMSALQQAKGADVSVDYFYDNLSGGSWIDVEGYGYGWQPDVAVNDSTWRPYADGYWAYTDDGWTWISYEDFGWATYHYGRWANLSDYGWIWFPGEDLDWGPAWVSWRTGGDYVGWAPLPPRGPGIVYEGGPIGPQVDIQFDIGPQYYNFCEVRYIGEPVLRNYIAPPVQNVTYINNTVNVTNITIKNNVVYNYGPNYETLSAHSARPIQRLNIERQSATNLSAAAKSGTLTKVQGNKLLVAAPPKLAKAPPTARPAAVKTKVAQPKLNRGWAGVSDEAQLKQKIKTENSKNIPPPTGAGAAKTGTAPPAIGAASASPALRGKSGRVPPGVRPTPPGTIATPAGVSASPFERGNRQGEPVRKPKPMPTAASAQGREKVPVQSLHPSPPTGDRAKPESRFGPTPAQHGPANTNTPAAGRGKTGLAPDKLATPPVGQGPHDRQNGVDRGRRGGPPAAAQPGERQGAKEPGQPGLNRPPSAPPFGPRTGEPRGGKEKGQGAYGRQPNAGAPAAAERNQGQPERGKKKGEGTPPPRPY